MAYTSHGHHIPNTLRGSGTVGEVVNCGGVDTCPRCKREIETTMAVTKVNFIGEAPLVVRPEDLDEEFPLVNRLEGHPNSGQVIGTAKLEKMPNGNIIAHVDMDGQSADILRRGFSLGSFSIAED